MNELIGKIAKSAAKWRTDADGLEVMSLLITIAVLSYDGSTANAQQAAKRLLAEVSKA